jgi:hypothetical protein
MSIDSKIAEIMEESKLLGLYEEESIHDQYHKVLTDNGFKHAKTEKDGTKEYHKGKSRTVTVYPDGTANHMDERGSRMHDSDHDTPESLHHDIKEELEDYSVEELEEFMMSEDFEQLDELSKSTLGSYMTAAKRSRDMHKNAAEVAGQEAKDYAEYQKHNLNVSKAHKKDAAEHKARGNASNDPEDKINSAIKHTDSLAHRKEKIKTAISARRDKQSFTNDKITHDNITAKRTKGLNLAAKKVLTKEAIDVSADVDALMFGESLSEEFREKAATIFESAVVVRVKEEVARLEEEFEEKLAEQVDSITEGLVEKIDGYLDYVVEQWIEQNEIALENGLKSDIMESFITGMKGLFQEHYIDVPEEKYDVIGEMETKIDMLESKLNEQVERNIDLKKSLSESVRKEIVSMVSEGLTDTETEKFTALVEELSYDDEDSFKVKVQTIRENYFTGKQSTLVESVVTDSPVDELNPNKYVNVDPTVAAYAKALQQYNN